MTLTFEKQPYHKLVENLTEAQKARILQWDDETIIIDDTGLPAAAVTKIRDFILRRGYKEV